MKNQTLFNVSKWVLHFLPILLSLGLSLLYINTINFFDLISYHYEIIVFILILAFVSVLGRYDYMNKNKTIPDAHILQNKRFNNLLSNLAGASYVILILLSFFYFSVFSINAYKLDVHRKGFVPIFPPHLNHIFVHPITLIILFLSIISLVIIDIRLIKLQSKVNDKLRSFIAFSRN